MRKRFSVHREQVRGFYFSHGTYQSPQDLQDGKDEMQLLLEHGAGNQPCALLLQSREMLNSISWEEFVSIGRENMISASEFHALGLSSASCRAWHGGLGIQGGSSQ